VSPSASVESAVGAAVSTAMVLFLVRFAGRVRSALLGREPHASPFL